MAAARFKISIVHSVADALDIIEENTPQLREPGRSQSWLRRLGLGLG